jgi:L-ribulose-5-phosphate 3-epimerase
MNPKFRIAAITDEFSPDLATALEPMAAIGMTGVELRVVFGKNIMNLSPEELDQAQALVAAKGMEVISIASPLLKCTLPQGGEVDSRFQHDIFASKHTFEDQPRLTEHAFKIAKQMGARIIRVFSYWRTVDPERCFDGVVTALTGLS